MTENSRPLELVFSSIGLDRDYGCLDLDSIPPDLQGWASDSPCFRRVLEELRPEVVIEVGSWKGASVVHMARLSQELGLATRFICVDTWLGSNPALWLQPGLRGSLRLEGGYPTLYRTFLRNIRDAGVQDAVFPLPMTSSAASQLLLQLGVRADLVYLDAGHQEAEVFLDLCYYFNLLRPGGVLLGDDYIAGWPGVVAAADGFAARRGLSLTPMAEKFLIRKPLAAGT